MKNFYPCYIILFTISLITSNCHRDSAQENPLSSPPKPELSHSTVKVATIHFAPKEGALNSNRQKILALTQEAAEHGAKIVVHTEMATSGYSFFSRKQISEAAESIPGPTTEALGVVAKNFGIYIAIGMPVHNKNTNLFYNSAVFIGPDGNVLGVYHKRNNLLEAAYNAEEFGSVPTFETPYGKIGIVICSDLFHSQFPRLLAISGASILLAPANVGVDTDFLQVRAFENDFSIIVANRFGKGSKGEKPDIFNQDTFTIPLPFNYDFEYNSKSVIVSNTGQILLEIKEYTDKIGYGELPVRTDRLFPVVRRPDLYALLGQDTLEPYTLSQFGLPKSATFAAAAINPDLKTGNVWEVGEKAVHEIIHEASLKNYHLKLIVFPSDFFPNENLDFIKIFKEIAEKNKVDLVLHFGNEVPPRSLLITSDAKEISYRRTHRDRQDDKLLNHLGNDFWVVDRDYARLAILHDRDLFAPETSSVMAKMGVDIIAVNANYTSDLGALWRSRTSHYLHLIVANKSSKSGIYLGGYKSNPSYREDSRAVLMEMNTEDVRNKKESRFLDFIPLLEPCGKNNC